MEDNVIKSISAIMSVVGSGLLAWRVKGIIDPLRIVAISHEANLQQILQRQDAGG